MATGGHHNDGKEIRQKIDSTNNGNNLGDRPAGLPWPSLPNNLELNTKSKHTKKKRNKEKDDAASTKRNIKVPVNQRSHSCPFQRTTSKSSMENQSTTQTKEEHSRNKNATAIRERLAHLQDCIAQVNSVLQHLKQSDEPRMLEQSMTMESILQDLLQKQAMIENLAAKTFKAEVPKLEEMRNMLSQDELVHKELLCQQILNEADVSNDEADESDSANSPFSPKPSDSNQSRDASGRPTYFTEEDKANIQNHLLEKMKTSQEKLTALKQQQALLLTMRRNAEEKLAAFQAELGKNGLEGTSARDWQYPPESNSVEPDDSLPNGDASWKVEYNSNPHVQLASQNTQKVVKNGPKNFLDGNGDSNTQELTTLHVNLEHIKRRLEVLQEYSDDRNIADPPSPAECEVDQNLSNRLLAVEWQRKKLKNRLLELQEKKKASDELMKELCLIKEAANAVENLNGEETGYTLSNIQEPPAITLHDDNEGGALEAMRETISQLRGMLMSRSLSTVHENQETDAAAACFPTSSSQDSLAKQNSYRVSPGKRDNIKKGQGDQFPARRHYEAEGRANEDPDVPTAPPPVSPAPEPDSWDKGQRRQKKRRDTQQKQQHIQAMFNSMNGKLVRIPNSVLYPIPLLEDEDFSADEADTATDNEDSQENDDSSGVAEEDVADIITKVKEELREVSEPLRRVEEEERDEASANIDELQYLEKLKNDRDQLLKLQEKFSLLRQKFSAQKPNNEELRSRGEGGNLQKRKGRSPHAVSVTNPLPPQQVRQENLLTRQNVATVESQNRNNSSNLTRGSNPSLKKDNINDLSAKYNHSAGHSSNRGNSDLLCKFRTEMKSQDLHDSHHKSQFVDIMKQDRNKLQNYSRNRDVHVHSNSSVNSEPLDGSSSALAPDTTVAATWGGSSTQENFEDENEPFESLEEQEEEEEESNNGDAMVLSNSADVSMNDNMLGVDPILPSVPKSYGSAPQYSNYSSTKRRDNRLHKYFKSTQLNQWTARKNFTRPGYQRVQPMSDGARDFSGPDDTQGQAEDASQTSAGSLNSANPMPMPDKFMQRLHQHLEKLNALCRPVLQEPLPTASMTCQTVPSQTSLEGGALPSAQFPLLNPCRPPQAVPDVMQSYTQQLQLQQQLLLSLSHCYHALYMQQLEIHHLQRCITQGPDSDVPLQQANQPAQTAEDFTLRPWFLSPWLSSTVPFPPSQISPMSAPPFIQQSQPAFAFSPTVQPTNTGAASTPRALVTSIQPARAVVHPAAQDSRTNSETLNNQVTPRTRANNFLDNFRSYSRQNLLSSANVTKGKESSVASGGPQVRQVHPLVPNESTWGHRSRVFIPPHTENAVTTTTTTQPADMRSFVRPISNPEGQDTVSKPKKPNLNRQHVSQVMPDSSSVASATPFSTCPEPDQSFRSIPEENACSERCPKPKPGASTSTSISSSSQPLPDNIHSEISKLLAQNSSQEGVLEELLRELRSMKSNSLQRALGAIREFACHERIMFSLSSTVRHLESDSHVMQDRPELSQPIESRPDGSTPAGPGGSCDQSAFKLACENACQRGSQNWPPATIIPLGKHIPKPSTGAVKKRPSNSRESAACNASPSLLTAASESQANEDKMTRTTDFMESMVERVVLELIPFIQCHNMDDCCTSLRANFSAKVVEALKNHCALKLSPEFLAQLRQTLMQVTSKYASSKWFECEADLLKSVAATLFREVTLYKSMSLRLSLEENSDHSVKNPQPDVLPSSSKSFVDAHKQIIPNKDREVPVDVDSNCSYSVPEFESNVGDLYVNMASQDVNLPTHCNGSVQHEPIRGAIGGNCSPPVNSWQNHTVSAEDGCYECDPEAEGEPEVEAGTEADLAEADQSPAPQGTANGMGSADGFHVPQPCLSHLSHIIAVNAEESGCAEGVGSGEAVLNLSLSAQASCNNNTDKEITLDDIPTKLTPMSQEELQRQMAEEQNCNLLLVAHQLDGTEDLPLAGSGDNLKEPPTFI